MKNKRCIRFLVITLVLVISMFSNVFASGESGWTCTRSYKTDYNIGDTVDYISDVGLTTSPPYYALIEFKSNFNVKTGDIIELGFSAVIEGSDEEAIEQSASFCLAQLLTEDGTLLDEVRFELKGGRHEGGTKQVNITNQTAGKLRLYMYLEDTGNHRTKPIVEELYVNINGRDS